MHKRLCASRPSGETVHSSVDAKKCPHYDLHQGASQLPGSGPDKMPVSLSFSFITSQIMELDGPVVCNHENLDLMEMFKNMLLIFSLLGMLPPHTTRWPATSNSSLLPRLQHHNRILCLPFLSEVTLLKPQITSTICNYAFAVYLFHVCLIQNINCRRNN